MAAAAVRHAFPSPVRRQRGAAALIVTMLLFFAMVLVAVFVNRNLVFEQRSSANQYRSTQAFEAAEAGLEWTLAQLNLMQRLGPDCLPSTAPDALTFRERHLRYERADASFSAVTWDDAGVAAALRPGCVRSGSGGWTCGCPSQGLPTLVVTADRGAPLPAFSVQLFAGLKPGTVRVVSTGCTRLAGPCRPGAADAVDASARVEVGLGLLGGLRTAPAAALTVVGAVDAGSAALGVHNPDPGTGLAIHAGAAIDAPRARLTPPAGAPAAAALVDHDAALAGTLPDRLFAGYFGLAKAGWKNQPAVTRLACSGDCSSALAAAIGGDVDRPLVWIDGDARLAGPLTLGSAQRPVAIVVAGALRLQGAVAVHGIVYAGATEWHGGPAGGALLRGALVSESGYSGDAAADLAYDSGVLALLKGNTGSFARISGSWRDF